MENNKQKILIIGSGGREHAIGWKIKQSPNCGELYFAPGNGGTSLLGTNIDIKATDIEALIKFAKTGKIDPVRSRSPQGDRSTRFARAASNGVDLTLAVPDDPLALGIVDEFKKEGLRIWGPTKNAAKLEWSKAFAKDFMERHNLPTAKFKIFTDMVEAKKYVKEHSFPLVIKASGLALGKGVIIAQNLEEANKTLEDIFVNKVFGVAGEEIVIEEFLIGPEISIHAFSDGKNYKMFPPAQDHKKIGENDTGLNTGGMGTIAPLPFVTDEILKEAENKIVAPTLKGMQEENNNFLGLLYPGLMLTKDGLEIIEFNSRFGDPETETYMRLLDSDLLQIFNACIDGTLNEIEIKWKKMFACTIVLASGGYPEKYEKGKIISGIDSSLEEYPKGEVDDLNLSTPSRKRDTPQEGNKDIVIFHAGTKYDENHNLVTNGGRVLGVSATGDNLKEALEKAYKAIEKISFEGMYYRKDIGQKTLAMKV